MTKRYKISKKFLIFFTLFIGFGAVLGSVCMFIEPSGKLLQMESLLPYFQVLPFSEILFQNYIFSGVALLIVNGLTNLCSAYLLIKNKEIGVILGTIFGITLMLWIIIQFIIFPFNFMSITFFVLGLLQFITGYICYVGYNQSMFTFNEKDYPNICKNSKNLVVYFSRQGYTKKLAYEIANKQGAEILEIKTTEKISGNLGFWWCGRFAMHKWSMPIEENNIDLSKYDLVTICTPIWAFNISAPMLEFCKQNKGKIKNVNYVIVHFMKAKFSYISDNLDKLLDVKHKNFESYSSHFGKLTKIK